jgi:hypothetical protein
MRAQRFRLHVPATVRVQRVADVVSSNLPVALGSEALTADAPPRSRYNATT